MNRTLSCSVAIIAGALVAVAAPGAAHAQGKPQQISIDSTALSYYPGRAGKRLILVPVIMRDRWQDGTAPDTSTHHFRDSLENSILAKGLHGTAARRADVEACAGGVTGGCPFQRDDVLTVAISEPNVVGDTATLFLRVGQLEQLGDARLFSGVGVGIHVVRLTRSGTKWVLRCMRTVFPTTMQRPAPDFHEICDDRGR